MLKSFFQPQSAAVVGASREPGKVGRMVLENMQSCGYSGRLYPVNPKADTILGLRAYPSVADLPEAPELVIVVVPGPRVLPVIHDCGRRGSRAVIVISAGFGETGPEGEALERQLVAAVRSYGMRLIGPNCLGLADTWSPINASFIKQMPRRGRVALISQSGALGTSLLDMALTDGVGFSKFISFGNRADVSELELIEYLADDPHTAVIAAYIEGVKDGARFLHVAREASRKKPIVLYKAGTTDAGARAVSSHTGSLAGSDRAYAAAFKQAGCLRAESVSQLFSLAAGLACGKRARGRRVGVLTNAGGPGIIVTDFCEKVGLTLASLSAETIMALQQELPPAASSANPVDILGDALSTRYRAAGRQLLADRNVDVMLALLTPQATTEIEQTAEVLIELAQGTDKPVLAAFMGRETVHQALRRLNEGGVPCFSFPEQAVRSIAAMAAYNEHQSKAPPTLHRPEVDRAAAATIIDGVLAEGRTQMAEIEARRVFAAYRIPTARTELAADAEAAVAAARTIGYPVVLKIASPDILHKTEVGGVEVGLTTDEEVRASFQAILQRARRHAPEARLWGVAVQQMLRPGRELIVGAIEDPQFGHLLMTGIGGIYVEILRDTSFRVVPITEEDAWEMLDELKARRLLASVRGKQEADYDSIVDALTRVSCLVHDFPQIRELDINPLRVYPRGMGCVAADARLVLNQPEAAGP